MTVARIALFALAVLVAGCQTTVDSVGFVRVEARTGASSPFGHGVD